MFLLTALQLHYFVMTVHKTPCGSPSPGHAAVSQENLSHLSWWGIWRFRDLCSHFTDYYYKFVAHGERRMDNLCRTGRREASKYVATARPIVFTGTFSSLITIKMLIPSDVPLMRFLIFTREVPSDIWKLCTFWDTKHYFIGFLKSAWNEPKLHFIWLIWIDFPSV